jgi:hypothetical protein
MSRQASMIRLHGRDNNMTYSNDGVYTWTFRNYAMGLSVIQLVDFDIPVPLDKTTRLFVRVPKVTCVQETNETSHDLCYMISIYNGNTGERLLGRTTCRKVGQEIPVVLMGNQFSLRITDEDENPVRLIDDDFDFIFKVR